MTSWGVSSWGVSRGRHSEYAGPSRRMSGLQAWRMPRVPQASVRERLLALPSDAYTSPTWSLASGWPCHGIERLSSRSRLLFRAQVASSVTKDTIYISSAVTREMSPYASGDVN